MENANTNWGKSVTGVLILDNKVLLARHTYGNGKGMLIVPGGYLEGDELPEEAVKREYMEETGIVVEPTEVLAIRFNTEDWYVCFRVEYVSGEARSDNDENSEVVWVDVDEALGRDDVPDLTKKFIESALSGKDGLRHTDYVIRRAVPAKLYTLNHCH